MLFYLEKAHIESDEGSVVDLRMALVTDTIRFRVLLTQFHIVQRALFTA